MPLKIKTDESIHVLVQIGELAGIAIGMTILIGVLIAG